MKNNFSSAMAVTKDTTCTASNLRWNLFLTVIGSALSVRIRYVKDLLLCFQFAYQSLVFDRTRLTRFALSVERKASSCLAKLVQRFSIPIV